MLALLSTLFSFVFIISFIAAMVCAKDTRDLVSAFVGLVMSVLIFIFSMMTLFL